jgi:hypothetical protein
MMAAMRSLESSVDSTAFRVIIDDLCQGYQWERYTANRHINSIDKAHTTHSSNAIPIFLAIGSILPFLRSTQWKNDRHSPSHRSRQNRFCFDCRKANDPATIKDSTNENNSDVDGWTDTRRLRINGKQCSEPWRWRSLNFCGSQVQFASCCNAVVW